MNFRSAKRRQVFMPNTVGDLGGGAVSPSAGPVQSPVGGAGGRSPGGFEDHVFIRPKIVLWSFLCIASESQRKTHQNQEKIIIFYQTLVISFCLKSDKTGYFWQ